MRTPALLPGLIGLGLLHGCATPPAGFDSPLPHERLSAIARAVRDQDKTAAPRIVVFLNSDDPAVRLASIRALESLTGQTLGYDHAASEDKRRAGYERWVEWCNLHGTATNAGSTQESQKISG